MIEMLVGVIVLVPIALFLFDLGTMVLGNIINGDLSKTVARAAASSPDGDSAKQAALKVVDSFAKSGIISGINLDFLDWRDPAAAKDSPQIGGQPPAGIPSAQPGQVLAATTLTVTLPVPFPMLPTTQKFTAYSIQPIVAVRPNLPGSQGP